MELYITRHPLTEEIEKGIIQGKNCGSVSSKGYEQVFDFMNLIDDVLFDRIISSDAKRCVQMTRKIVENRKVPFIFTGEIDEKYYGKLTGTFSIDVQETDMSGSTPETRRYSDGENLIDVQRRARDFLNRIVSEYGNTSEKILIVSHSIFLSIFLGEMLNYELMKARNELILDHCSLSHFKFNSETRKFELIFFNRVRDER